MREPWPKWIASAIGLVLATAPALTRHELAIAAMTGEAHSAALLTKVGAWQLSCPYDENGKRSGCVASLRVTQPSTEGAPGVEGLVVMEWTISKNAQGALESRFAMRTGVMLAPGLRLKFDGSAERTLVFLACDARACVVRLPMDELLVSEAGNAKEVAAAVVGIDRRTYTYTFDPAGIDKVIKLVR